MNISKTKEYYLKKESDSGLLIHAITDSLSRRQITNRDKIIVHVEGCRVPVQVERLAKLYDFIEVDDSNAIGVEKKIPTKQYIKPSNFNEESIVPVTDTNFKVILSMTSWKGRLWKSAVPTLETLLSQKMTVPYKVVLVLSSDEINPISVPDDIKEMEKLDNFELLWVKQDIRSHKKLIPVLRRYPNLPIIISDDDCTRNPDWAQSLYEAYLKEPNMIHTWACGSLSRVENGTLEFDFNTPIDHPSILNRAANGNVGTLYPPHIFDEMPEFFDPSLYMQLSPTSDETWQWCFQAMLGIKTNWLRKDSLAVRKLDRIKEVQDVALFNTNKDEYKHVYANMLRKYPKLKDILESELSKEGKIIVKKVIRV